MRSIGILGLALAWAAFVHPGAAAASEQFSLPDELAGVRIYATKEELIEAKPNLKRAVIPYIKGPGPSTHVDAEAPNDGLIELFQEKARFTSAFYEVRGRKLVAVILGSSGNKMSPIELARLCISLWGPKFRKSIEVDKHVEFQPGRYLALEWRRGSEIAHLACRPDKAVCELAVLDPSKSSWDRFKSEGIPAAEVDSGFQAAGWGDEDIKPVEKRHSRP